MKKSIRNIMISAVMAAGIFAATATAMAATKFVETDMNFRTAASASSTILGSVPEGTKVEVLGSENGWDKILFGGKTGYIHGGNLVDNYAPKAETKNQVQAQAQQSSTNVSGSWRTVSVSDGYLAIRTMASFDASNEVGKLYNGDKVQLSNAFNGDYVLVYSPKYNYTGWVNVNYLTDGSASNQSAQSSTSSNTGSTMTGTWKSVSVNGYLALRNAAAYDASNEIGKLFTGDKVLTTSVVSGNYVQVYSPAYGVYGWVDARYIG